MGITALGRWLQQQATTSRPSVPRGGPQALGGQHRSPPETGMAQDPAPVDTLTLADVDKTPPEAHVRNTSLPSRSFRRSRAAMTRFIQRRMPSRCLPQGQLQSACLQAAPQQQAGSPCQVLPRPQTPAPRTGVPCRPRAGRPGAPARDHSVLRPPRASLPLELAILEHWVHD